MATIRAFKAFRPEPSLANKIASRPYDVLSSDEARQEAQGNAHSFLRINKPEIDLDQSVNPYSALVYEQGRKNLEEFIDKGWLIQEDKPCLYIYAQTMGRHHQKGIVACSSIDDYFEDRIKKHEYTRPKKEQDRIDHMAAVGAHIGPVFLTYKPQNKIDEIVNQWCDQNQPVYDFKSEDGFGHQVWVVDDTTTIDSLVALFKTIVPNTYVADGHHRSAASAKVGEQVRKKQGEYSGKESFNYFLSVLFPSDQLQIIDYNRVIKDLLPDITTDNLLTALLANFTVTPVDEGFKPSERGVFAMYIDKQWYRLKGDDSIIGSTDPVDSLDISILSNYVIDPLLGISDQRTDDRIDFVGGIRGIKELQRRVDSGEMRLAFAIAPVDIEQLIKVADSGKVMPPKSTWFEPKLRSGLFTHKFV